MFCGLNCFEKEYFFWIRDDLMSARRDFVRVSLIRKQLKFLKFFKTKKSQKSPLSPIKSKKMNDDDDAFMYGDDENKDKSLEMYETFINLYRQPTASQNEEEEEEEESEDVQ